MKEREVTCYYCEDIFLSSGPGAKFCFKRCKKKVEYNYESHLLEGVETIPQGSTPEAIAGGSASLDDIVRSHQEWWAACNGAG